MAKVAGRLDAFAPRAMALVLSTMIRLLPGAPPTKEYERVPGHVAQARMRPKARTQMERITTLGRRAAGRLNQSFRTT